MLRTILLKLSENKRLAQWSMKNGVSRRVAQRFVAGEKLDDAVAAARALNSAGFPVSLDILGEHVLDRDGAVRAADTYVAMFDRIAAEKLDGNVSLKLTQLGLDLYPEVCEASVLRIAECAARHRNFVRVDMEGSAYAQRTVDLVRRVRAKTDAVGTVIQSYLFRSEQDVRDLIAAQCRIRLVKGAYKEPPEIAFPAKADVDANFAKLMEIMLPSGIYHAIATHDPRLIDATKKFSAAQGIGKEKFEFQMLYGIRTDLQRGLLKEGYRVRVYVPFGTDWYPYFMRRLAERPANLTFFLRNFFR
ncbi:MAG: proline dehydrogenase family protein [Candidatus Acidiferrales bacterium]